MKPSAYNAPKTGLFGVATGKQRNRSRKPFVEQSSQQSYDKYLKTDANTVIYNHHQTLCVIYNFFQISRTLKIGHQQTYKFTEKGLIAESIFTRVMTKIETK